MESRNSISISILIFSISIIIGIIIFGVIYFKQNEYRNNELDKAIYRFNKITDEIMDYNNETSNNFNNELKLLLNNNYQLLNDSINNTIKNNVDNMNFWISFLSLIMVVFSIIGIVINNGYLEMSKTLFKKFEKESINQIEINYYFHMGLHYSNIENYQEAIINYEQVIYRNNKHFKSYSNRGFAYYNLNEYDKALKDYNQALIIILMIILPTIIEA